MELYEIAYSDLNGDGKVNAGDTYGLLVGARSYIQICDYCGHLDHRCRTAIRL